VEVERLIGSCDPAPHQVASIRHILVVLVRVPGLQLFCVQYPRPLRHPSDSKATVAPALIAPLLEPLLEFAVKVRQLREIRPLSVAKIPPDFLSALRTELQAGTNA
jgi:hypothetical protein